METTEFTREFALEFFRQHGRECTMEMLRQEGFNETTARSMTEELELEETEN